MKTALHVLLIILVSLSFLLAISNNQVHAQQGTYYQSQEYSPPQNFPNYQQPQTYPNYQAFPNYSTYNNYAPNLNPEVPQNLQTLTQSVMIELLGSTACILTGVNPMHSERKCLTPDPATGKLGYAVDEHFGMLGFSGNLIATTATLKTASSIDYLAEGVSNFGFVKKSYAQTQSYGFRALEPIRDLWKRFRDLTYLLFVIILVVIGISIMLRLNIDPRTVMTVQNQIPRLAIALVLISLSYAIAGFLIDFMWISIYLVVQTFADASGDPNVRKLLVNPNRAAFFVMTDMFNVGFPELIGRASWGIGTLLADIMKNFFSSAFGLMVGTVMGGILGPAGQAVNAGQQVAGFLCSLPEPTINRICVELKNAVDGVVRMVTASVPAALAFIIFTIAMLWAMFRLWFSLLKAYIFIIVSIIFAPFWILGGLIPGSGLGFGPWLRDLLGNLVAFPVTFAIFALGRILIEKLSCTGGCTELFVPPLIGSTNDASGIGAIMGLAIILIAPEAVNMSREALKSPQFKYVTAVGRAVGAGSGTLTGAPGSVASLGSQMYGLSHFKGIKRFMPWMS